jgi:hypothetical protein
MVGYAVISLDGRRIGVVAGVSSGSIVVEIRRWLQRSWRALPPPRFCTGTSSTRPHANPARELTRSPRLSPDLPVADARVAESFRLERG